MFCPVCRSEYRAGFTECAECKVPLVESLQPAEAGGEPNLRLVTVYETGDPALIALAKSILESAEIPFMTSNESVQNYFGWGSAPGLMNIVTGPVQIKVEEHDAEEAEALLSELHSTPGLPPDEDLP